MRTKIGLLSILMTVLLAFGGAAVAQEYEEPQDPTLQEQEAVNEPDVDVDVEGEPRADVDVDLESPPDADTEAEEGALGDDTMTGDEELPQTASFLPVLGALGLLSLAGGAALRNRKQ
jgi:LPXTG-motif cell wall-anchored protein